MPVKTHKKKKVKKMRGRNMGTHGGGARKKRKKSGHRGGCGMAGSGKRADHKKTLILNLYGHDYFGKSGITSRKTERDKSKRINLKQIQENLPNYVKKGLAKKTKDSYEVNLEKYKILGDASSEIKEKLIIKAQKASKSAIDKIEKAGGKIELPVKKEKKVEGSEKKPNKE